MLDFSMSEIHSSAAHQVGTKARSEELYISDSELRLDSETEALLLHYMALAMRGAREYSFVHPVSNELNSVYTVLSKTSEVGNIYDASILLAKLLYELGVHPNIKKGTLLVVKIKNIRLENELFDGVGILKIEGSDSFLRVTQEADRHTISLNTISAFSPDRIDKGCVVLWGGGKVARVYCVEPHRDETKYWTKSFLGIEVCNNDALRSARLSAACMFVSSQITDNEGATKKIEFLGGALSYFDEHDEFSYQDFSERVLGKEHANFFEKYAIENEFSDLVHEPFTIVRSALKGISRPTQRTVILDNGIKIIFPPHGIDNVEIGTDDVSGKSFYKIYFTDER